MKTKISFVVLTHNDWKTAMVALKSIRDIKTAYSYDVFVVDNGSWDGTPGIIKKEFKGVNVIELPKNIGTAAYDAAIKKSKSEYIYFTGCDIEIRYDALDKLADFLEKNDDAVLAAPRYVNFYDRKKTDLGGTWLSKSFYSGIFKDRTLGKKPVELPYAGTGLIRRGYIKKTGCLFDNDYFFYGEDVDLGMRIRLEGLKVFYVPDAVVYHRGSVSRNVHEPGYLTFLMERNLLMTFFKTLDVRNIILLTPYAVFMRALAVLKDVVKLDFKCAFARIKAVLWIAFNFSRISAKRRRIQQTRRADDAHLFKLFSERHIIKQYFYRA